VTQKMKVVSLTAVAAIASMIAAPVALAQKKIIVPQSSIERPEDIGRRAHTNFVFVQTDTPSSSPAANWETPGSIACVYHLVPFTAGCPIATATAVPSGGTKAIAIVDAFDNPKASQDLATFSAQFGLPTAVFNQVYASGVKPRNDSGGWSVEEALDIEWAHAMAPNAVIYLVEGTTNSFADLYAAETVASNLVASAGGGQVSNSWSGGEYSTELADEASFFSTPGVVYFASTGDSGLNAIGVPAVFANVVAVGGTTVKRNATGAFTGEQFWTGGGGGISQFEAIPLYQKNRTGITGTKRSIPDISSDADPNSGVAMYDADGGFNWIQVGGTSVSAPTMAGIVNAAGGFKTSSKQELFKIYNEYSNATLYKQLFRDITLGDSHCKVGWDICTGVGSPLGLRGE
jgi:kumamolisin